MKREKEKKVKVSVLLLGIFLIVILFFFYGMGLKKEQEEKTRKTYEEAFTSDKKYQNLLITEIEKTTDHVIATLSNTSDIVFISEEVEVVFLSAVGEVIGKSSYIIPTMDAHSKASLNIVLEQKCKNAYTFVLNKKKEDKNE